MNTPPPASRKLERPVALDVPSAKRPELGFAWPAPAEISVGRAIAGAALGIVVLAGTFVVSYLPKVRARRALQDAVQAEETRSLAVAVTTPTVASSQRSIKLPGAVRALEEVVVYPRATGYVRKWHFDIGSRVKEGDVLAEIDAPEVDQQIAQARAQVAQAEAGLVLAKANAAFSHQGLRRYEELAPSGLASQEELEKRRAQAEVDESNVTVSNANIQAQQANLQRLLQLKSFDRALAPFSGTVIERHVERGMLVAAGTASPLFRIASIDPARVFVQVPQDMAPGVSVGTAAMVKIREFPGRDFSGLIAHVAGALDNSTRTMTVEVRVANPDGELLAGMYADVVLSLPAPHRVLTFPATALFNDANGTRVAVVGADARIRLTPVLIERDTGSTIEIAAGLEGSELIVKLASAQLSDGQIVEVVR